MPPIRPLSVLVFLSLSPQQLAYITKQTVFPYELNERNLWASKLAKFFRFSKDYLDYYNCLSYPNRDTFMDIYCKFSLSSLCLENYEPSYALLQALLRNRTNEALFFYSLLTPQQRELITPYFFLGREYMLYRTRAKRVLWSKMGRDLKGFPLSICPYYITVENIAAGRENLNKISTAPNSEEFYKALSYLISLRNQNAFDLALNSIRRNPSPQKVREIWLGVLRSGGSNFFDHFLHYLHLYLGYPLLPRLDLVINHLNSPPKFTLTREEVEAVYYGCNQNVLDYMHRVDKRSMQNEDVSSSLFFSETISPKPELYFQILRKHLVNLTYSRDLELIEVAVRRLREIKGYSRFNRFRRINRVYFHSIKNNLGNAYLVFRLSKELSPLEKKEIIDSDPSIRVLYPQSVALLEKN